MPRTDEPVENVRTNARKFEKKLTEKRREQTVKKSEPAALNERLVAPVLLVITVLISYLIVLFS